jgi:transcription initiation factor IIE alpha subunit
MTLEEYTQDKLWPILVEAVHSLVMFPSHKGYTRAVILPEKPEVKPQELALRLQISLGEAVVILYELHEERKAGI